MRQGLVALGRLLRPTRLRHGLSRRSHLILPGHLVLPEAVVANRHHHGLVRHQLVLDAEALLKVETARDLLGCDEVTCMTEIGGAIGADYVVRGNVGPLSGADVGSSMPRAPRSWVAPSFSTTRRAASSPLSARPRERSWRGKRPTPTSWDVHLPAPFQPAPRRIPMW